nr:DUF4197 family protein [Novosphingobium sp. FKTRR1]
MLAAGGSGLIALTLAACASLPPLSLDEAVRRLLRRSADRALTRLTAPGGGWDGFIARADLPGSLGAQGGALARLLTSPQVRVRLRESLRPAAERAVRRAAPVLADAVRQVGIANARAILRGGPHAATAYLRGEMRGSLVQAMLPEFADLLHGLDDPLLGSALSILAGVDVSGWVRELAARADDVLWDALADAEAEIRADPRATGDAMLVAALALAATN